MKDIVKSTIGKKFIVALTGLILFGFVVGHLVGNLQVFLGAEKLNAYAHFLKSSAGILWGTRLTLLAAAFLHIYYTVQLTRLNRAARPIAYAQQEPIHASLPSRLMIWSGAFLGLYVIYHLLHFTTGSAHPQFNPTDVYSNMIIAFSSIPVSAVYILAMISLGFHLHHGVFSVFQTLGLNHPKYNRWRRCLAQAAGWLIPIGYISIPAAVLLGFLHL